jgi:hypothetical protein
MCRAPHTYLGSTRPRAVPRRPVARRLGRGEWAAAARLSHLTDAEIALAFQNRWAEHGGYRQMLAHRADYDLNPLAQIRAAHRRLAGRRARKP